MRNGLIVLLMLFVIQITCLANDLGNGASTTDKTQTTTSQNQGITFFGGFPYNADFIDVLKYFDSIPTVKEIKAIPEYLVRNRDIYDLNLKGKINKNIFNLIYPSSVPEERWKNIHGFSKKIYLSDGKSINVINEEITFRISEVLIAGIPFYVDMKVLPMPESYFYNKGAKLQYYYSFVIPYPYYEITSMVFHENRSSGYRDYGEKERENLISLYNNKYGKYRTKRDLNYGGSYIPAQSNRFFIDNNMLIDIYPSEDDSIGISYRNLNMQHQKYKEQYDEYQYNKTLKENEAQSQNSAI